MRYSKGDRVIIKGHPDSTIDDSWLNKIGTIVKIEHRKGWFEYIIEVNKGFSKEVAVFEDEIELYPKIREKLRELECTQE